MERMLERCAGLDVHKKTVTACVRIPGTNGDRAHHVRTFDTTTAALLVLRDWLAAHAVTHVAMESSIPDPEARLRLYPHQFSGGMRQRIMIAMALACHPALVLADEPTTALDVTIQAQVLELLRDLARRLGVALLLITHNLGVVARYADRMNVMYAGRIVEQAPARALYADPRHPDALGLLRSAPRLDEPRRERLAPIEGRPPDLMRLPPGCAFAPRCPFRVARCADERPPLMPVADAHLSACWEASRLARTVER
jgi:oligopeptide/dipeptide ABC transporter ATP-binding protein